MPAAAVVLAIADALVADLATDPFLLGLGVETHQAARAYAPILELEDMAGLHLTVVPRSQASTRLARGLFEETYEIDVAVQQRAATDAERDALMLLAQAMHERYRSQRLTAYPAAVCVGGKVEPLFAREHLLEHGVFTSVLTLTYQLGRP